MPPTFPFPGLQPILRTSSGQRSPGSSPPPPFSRFYARADEYKTANLEGKIRMEIEVAEDMLGFYFGGKDGFRVGVVGEGEKPTIAAVVEGGEKNERVMLYRVEKRFEHQQSSSTSTNDGTSNPPTSSSSWRLHLLYLYVHTAGEPAFTLQVLTRALSGVKGDGGESFWGIADRV